jgi:hypothetical protein
MDTACVARTPWPERPKICQEYVALPAGSDGIREELTRRMSVGFKFTAAKLLSRTANDAGDAKVEAVTFAEMDAKRPAHVTEAVRIHEVKGAGVEADITNVRLACFEALSKSCKSRGGARRAGCPGRVAAPYNTKGAAQLAEG